MLYSVLVSVLALASTAHADWTPAKALGEKFDVATLPAAASVLGWYETRCYSDFQDSQYVTNFDSFLPRVGALFIEKTDATGAVKIGVDYYVRRDYNYNNRYSYVTSGEYPASSAPSEVENMLKNDQHTVAVELDKSLSSTDYKDNRRVFVRQGADGLVVRVLRGEFAAQPVYCAIVKSIVKPEPPKPQPEPQKPGTPTQPGRRGD
ncbi:MAG: hypothetical protein HY075_11465 [Deltaproteobacteria bacterium]|nr:hypothetical protein [Deltaproteobacteria bacterium]